LLDSIDKPGASNEDNRQEPQGTGGGFFETFKDLFGGGSAGSGGQMNRQFGGPIGASMVSLVGEAGRELLKMGNSGGEVINNTTTEKIMGAANAVVNNIGNDSMDTLKQISSTLAQSNQIQSNILKETRRSKGFEY